METGHYRMKDGTQFALIGAEGGLERAWPFVREYLAEALRHSLHAEWSVDEVYERIRNGQFLLSVVLRDGAVIGAQVFDKGTDGQGRRFVGMICCGGFDMDEWLGGLVALCKKLCELHGAERIVVVGRRGWERKLYAYGVRARAMIGGARTEDITTPVEFEDLAGRR